MSTSPRTQTQPAGTGPAQTAAQPRSGTEAATYQRLREHLAYLRLPDAAAAMPGVLDDARTQAWSATATIERLLAAEVDATESRRLASRQHFACAGEIAEFLHHLARIRSPAQGGDPADHTALLAHKADLLTRIANQHDALTDPDKPATSPNTPCTGRCRRPTHREPQNSRHHLVLSRLSVSA